MSLFEVIETRRSVRNFSNKPLADEEVIKIIEAGRLAPSGFNRQPCRFIYVKDLRILRMVKNCSPGFYGNAAAAIVIGIEAGKDDFARERSKAFHRESTGDVVGVLDVGFAAENILLAAHSLGLGACAIASFNEVAIRKVLKMPDNWRPLLIISLGYPDKIPDVPPKLKLWEITFIDEFGSRWDRLGASP